MTDKTEHPVVKALEDIANNPEWADDLLSQNLKKKIIPLARELAKASEALDELIIHVRETDPYILPSKDDDEISLYLKQRIELLRDKT